MDQARDVLRHPGAIYRLCPLFVFNEEHEGELGEPRITELLTKLKEAGFGGIYIHPRPGMLTEYLSERWFELVRHTVRECRRLGLIPGLYDENSYPSGFAGGAVPAKVPDTRSQYILPIRGSGTNLPRGSIATYAVDADNRPTQRLADPSSLTADTEWMTFVLRDMPAEPFLGEGSYVSILDPLATHTFLQETHDRYRKALSDEDWEGLGAVFTDEPHLPGSSLGNWSPGLHFNQRILAAFKHTYEYDLLDHLPDLYFDGSNSSQTRFDFYELLHQLWMKNWAVPLHQWTKGKAITLTGHYLEHDWPAPYATPGQMHLLSRMDWPGTDFLECFALLGYDFYDLQGFESKKKGEEPHALYYLRQADSVARQYGKERVMNECWGAGGHDSKPADWLRIGRFLIVHGANHLVPHHTFQTLSGMRKMDHPQFFGDQCSFFHNLKPLNDELARLSAICTAGSTLNRILLLDVMTSGYTAARKADAIEPSYRFDAEAAPFADPLRSLLPLRQDAEATAQAMTNRLLDFDIGDEYILEEIGSAKNGSLQVGKGRYGCIVIPKGCMNLRQSTVDLIEAFLKSGGSVFLGQPGKFLVNGRPTDNLLKDWQDQHGNHCQSFASDETLIRALCSFCPPRIDFKSTIHSGIAVRFMEVDNTKVAILVNSHPDKVLSDVPKTTFQWKELILYRPDNDSIERLRPGDHLTLAATSAAVLFFDPPPTAFGKSPQGMGQPKVTHPAPVSLIEATRINPNVLVLDHCQIKVKDTLSASMSVYGANKLFWKSQGFSGNGWFMRTQHQSNLLKRGSYMLNETPTEFIYSTEIDSGVDRNKIELAIERPEQWSLQINDHCVDTGKATPWRDPRIARIGVGEWLQSGFNKICLRSEAFNLRQEVCPIYLIGNFSVLSQTKGFRMAPASDLDPNLFWDEQGLPFYDGCVDYQFRLNQEGRVSISLPRSAWEGACVDVIHSNQTEILYGPDLNFVIDGSSSRTFSMRVYGLPQNLFGPWHHQGDMRKRALPSFWSEECNEKWTVPAGNAYKRLQQGLIANQLLAISSTAAIT